jgi:hypothetical protein
VPAFSTRWLTGCGRCRAGPCAGPSEGDRRKCVLGTDCVRNRDSDGQIARSCGSRIPLPLYLGVMGRGEL